MKLNRYSINDDTDVPSFNNTDYYTDNTTLKAYLITFQPIDVTVIQIKFSYRLIIIN